MRTLSIDVETYSEIEIDRSGSYRYIEDESFELVLLAYAYDDGPVQVIDLMAGETIPKQFIDDLYDPTVVKTAWNAGGFERPVFNKYFNRYCPPEQWQDSMILAGVCGLPMGLAKASTALHLGEDTAKMKEGKALIKYFCKPCRPTKTNGGRTRNLPIHAPDKWETFKAYNAQDVVAERTIRNMLFRWQPDDIEHRFWCLDARINERGVRIDPTVVRNAIEMDNAFKAELIDQATELTGIDNPQSVTQIKAWLQEQEGIEVPSLNKKVIPDLIKSFTTDVARDFMDIRARLAKTSTAKYEAMERGLCADEHVRGCFAFYGANRTGRFAGRLIQLQNLPQNHMPDLAEARAIVRTGDYETVKLLYENVSSTLSELIRTALIPEPGHRFIVADFSAIEARVIAWIAGEQWALEEFEGDGLIYEATGAQMFHVPKLSIAKGGENNHLRSKAKIAVLACGYGGSIGALKDFGADEMGMTEADMVETVDLWRTSNSRICALWGSLEKAAIRCVERQTPTRSKIGKIRFDFEQGTLWMTLPSGRRLAYFGARYDDSRWRPGRKALSYMGVEQDSKKWGRVETWGGKLAENCTQATARDCLRDAMLALEQEGYDIRAHVHDEVIITEPVGGRTAEDVCAVMARGAEWSRGLPLRADGYETEFYTKD